MRKFWNLFLTGKMIIACWMAGLAINPAFISELHDSYLHSARAEAQAPVEKFGVGSKRKPAPKTSSPPARVEQQHDQDAPLDAPAVESGEPSEPVSEAAFTPFPNAIPDTRPVVEFHTALKNCPYCIPAHAFVDDPDTKKNFPLRFEVHEYADLKSIPQDVAAKGGVPLFHWLDGETGQTWNVVGFQSGDKLLESYQKVSKLKPHVTDLLGAPVGAGESPVELFSKFAGPGRFSWKPDKPVGAYVDDTTFVQYQSLAGSVKLVGGQPVITIDAPYPTVKKRMLGLWIGVQVYGASGQLDAQPPAFIVTHSRGRYRLEIKDLGK